MISTVLKFISVQTNNYFNLIRRNENMNDTILKKINDFNLNELKKNRSKEYILNLKRCSEDIKKAKNKNLKSIVENYDINLHDLIVIYTEKQPEAIRNTCVKLSKLVNLNVKNYQTDLLYDINFIIENPHGDFIFITYENGTKIIYLESICLNFYKNKPTSLNNILDNINGLSYNFLYRNFGNTLKCFYVNPEQDFIKSICSEEFINKTKNTRQIFTDIKNGKIKV